MALANEGTAAAVARPTARWPTASTSSTGRSSCPRSPRRTGWPPSASRRCCADAHRRAATVRPRSAGACHRLPRPPDRGARPGRQHDRLLPPRPAAVHRVPGRGRGAGARRGAPSPTSPAFLAALRRGGRRASAAVGDVGGAGGGRRPRAAPVRAARRAGAPTTSRTRCGRRRRRGGCPRRSRSSRWSALIEAAGRSRAAAGAARPGPAGAALRHRRADLRGGRAGRRRPRPRARATVRLAGKGGKERIVPVGSYALRGRRGVPGAGAAGAGGRQRPGCAAARCSSTPAAGALSRQSAWAILRAAAERAGLDAPRSRRTRCGTRSPPTCSTAAPTSASCRSCSATPR